MGLFTNNKNGGIMDVIRCDEQDYLVWKWRPSGADLGQTKRENSIRWGSTIRVKEGSVAVFIYSSENGTVQDYIVGPSDTVVDTNNLPVISSIIGLAYNGNSPFQAEVYFINLANTVQMKFAVPYFDVYDYELNEFSVPVAVRGSFDFNITDYKEFVNKHRLENLSVSDLQSKVRDAVSENAKAAIANAPEIFNIPVIHLEKKIYDIKEALFLRLKEKLYDSYGIVLTDVNLAAIDIDKESEGYKELKSVTKELTSASLKTINKAKIIAESREIKGSQTIGMLDKAASKFADLKETQFARHKKLQSEFAETVEDERAGKIGAIGGKMLRDVSKFVRNNAQFTETPPPIPGTVTYHVAIDGNGKGPFNLEELTSMADEGSLTEETLVWKKGMAEWKKAGTIEELNSLFGDMPSIPQI